MGSNFGDKEARAGVFIGLLAYFMWGIFPVYFKWIASVAPLEVLGHRVVWAVPFGALIICLGSAFRSADYSCPATMARS